MCFPYPLAPNYGDAANDDYVLRDGLWRAVQGVSEWADLARALESAVLAAHGPDKGGGTTLAEKLQPDERDRFLSGLAALWRDTGRDIPKGKPKEREPFIEFVTALHMAMGAGDIPDIEALVGALAI